MVKINFLFGLDVFCSIFTNIFFALGTMESFRYIFVIFYCIGVKQFFVQTEELYWWRAATLPLHTTSGYYSSYLKKNPTYRDYIKNSANIAVTQCRKLFQYDRWNCVSNHFRKPFGDIVELGCRETAFIYALTAASLVFHMTRACSQGRIEGCYNRCINPESVNPHFLKLMNSTHSKNQACDDNIQFGIEVWKDFVLLGEQSSDVRAQFNVKNSQVGLQEVHRSAGLVCRCLGVSGSCVSKICSEKITDSFEKVSHNLHVQYKEARISKPSQKVLEENSKELTRIREKSRKMPMKRTPKKRLTRRKRNFRLATLEFFERSPDFCQNNQYSAGVSARICQPFVTQAEYNLGKRPCHQFCCYGRTSRTVEKTIQSNCSFVYCCHVDCVKQRRMVEEFYCL